MTENMPEVTEPVAEPKKKKDKKKFLQRRSSWYLLGILIALVIVLVGALLGIPRGINDRVKLAEAQAAPKIDSQLELARTDIAEGRYQVAKTRLDWILDNMSPYLTEAELAIVGDLYSQTLLMLNNAGTPTPGPTATADVPTVTPTLDVRGEEDLFTTAQGYMAAESWDEAIQTLEALREKNLEYRAVEVDGMFYIALRNRGVNKILVDGSLEPGIYDLTLSEQFAPLDGYADGIRTWARLYLTGASYWDVNWEQVLYYFNQIYPVLPNLRDGTGMTATERYRKAAIFYAEQLAAAGEYCQAQEYLDKAQSLSSDPEVQPTAQWVANKCWEQQHPATEPPPEVTPTPTVGPTTETPPPTEETTPAP